MRLAKGGRKKVDGARPCVLPFGVVIIRRDEEAKENQLSDFGLCATDAREPRQVRKEATVASLSVCRRSTRSLSHFDVGYPPMTRVKGQDKAQTLLFVKVEGSAPLAVGGRL